MAATRRPLGAGVVTLIVIDAVLLLILAILVVQSRSAEAPGDTAGGVVTPTAPGATVVFASPTRNITCTMGDGAVTCQIAEFTYAEPSVEDCAGNAGHEVRLTADGATWVCSDGDPPGPAGEDVQVLPYGETASSGGFLCSSSEQGMTCRHEESGHSFSLARAGATLD